MRLAILGLAAAAAALAAAAAVAGDFPARKPGLWEITITGVGGTKKPLTAKLCLDQATSDALIGQGMAQAKSQCSKREVHFSGSTGTFDSICKFSTVTVTSHGTIVFTGDDAYRTISTMHYDPPMHGKADASVQSDGKWVSPCPADMKPGDMITATGARINVAPQASQ
ncbi:MAG: DUF3617 family protein [Dongiaceae bacterium]